MLANSHLQAALGLYDALNLTRPHVAGWSLGACAALKLAALHPDRVSKVHRSQSWSATLGVAVHGTRYPAAVKLARWWCNGVAHG